MGLEHPARHFDVTNILVLFALALGCSSQDPLPGESHGAGRNNTGDSPKTQAIQVVPEKSQPMVGLFGALDDNRQPAIRGEEATAAAASVSHIPWPALARTLPPKAQGWMLEGDPQGNTNPLRGIPVPQATCRLKKGPLLADVRIIDTLMNPLVAMPYNLARAVQIDSSKERIGRTEINNQPAAQKYNKRHNEAEVLIMVGGRILVTVTVHGAANETPAMELAKSLNLTLLSKLVGGPLQGVRDSKWN